MSGGPRTRDDSPAAVATRATHVAGGAALRYVEAYNKYQTLFAYFRLQGWLPSGRAAQPPELGAAYIAMAERFADLHRAAAGEDPPDYVARAKRRLTDEAQNPK